MARVPEVMDKFAHRIPQYNTKIRDTVSRQADATSAILPGNPVIESKKQDNIITLGNGDHGGIVLRKNNTQIKSIGDARITRQVTINLDPDSTDSSVSATFVGVTFISTTSNANRNNDVCLVVVNSGLANFVGCTFVKERGDPMNSDDNNFANFVMVQKDAKALFNGCTFSGTMAETGDVVRNHSSNAVGDCVIGFSVNTTGQTNSNCTNVEVMTP